MVKHQIMLSSFVTRIVFRRWELDCDPTATARIYSQLTSGAPERCGCAPCRNFAAVRKQVYPESVLRLFEELGIAFDREAEVYHNCRIEPGKHNYGGWLHFIGTIAAGSDASRQMSPNAWTFDLEDVTDRFKLGFTRRLGLVNKLFQESPVVQLEFQAIVPWVLAESEPIP